MSLEKLWGESCFWINHINLSPSVFERTFVVSLLNKFARDSHNYNLHVHRKILMETSLSLKYLILFYHFRKSTEEVQETSGNFARQSCQKCSLRVHRNILTTNLSLGNLFVTTFFTYWLKIFQATVSFFSTVLLKLHYISFFPSRTNSKVCGVARWAGQIRGKKAVRTKFELPTESLF